MVKYMNRKKANFDDLIKQDVKYHAYGRIKNYGTMGTRYILSQPLTDDQLLYFRQFKNVMMGTCYYKYDCHIEYDCLIIYDKCL